MPLDMPKAEDNKLRGGGGEGSRKKKVSCRKLLQHKGKALGNPRFTQLFEPVFGLGLWVWLGFCFFFLCLVWFFARISFIFTGKVGER